MRRRSSNDSQPQPRAFGQSPRRDRFNRPPPPPDDGGGSVRAPAGRMTAKPGIGSAAAPPAPARPLLSEQALGAVHYRIIALCFAAWIFDFYDLILYSFILVPIARELGLSPAESSLTMGVAFATTAIGGVLFGFLGDRYGRKPVIICSVLIYGAGTILCAFSHNLTQLLAYRSFTGL